MGLAFRAMVFLLLFSTASGITNYLFSYVPGYGGNNLESYQYSTGISQFNASMEQPVTGPNVETSNSISALYGFRFLDMISFGYYTKIKSFLFSTIYSFPALLFQSGIVRDVAIITAINSIMTLIYILGGFELITGKDLFSR